ncbi:hypothetical protein HanPSC8_Chr01g0006491 [Helianthus annuus]|nr:hypothetical protein HanPSC8_Chr01g0006491 [Helianthus annuus]
MHCYHSIVFRSMTSEAPINRISFNRYRGLLAEGLFASPTMILGC